MKEEGLEGVKNAAGLVEKDGRYFMRLDPTARGVEVSPEIGRAIQIAFRLQKKYRESPTKKLVNFLERVRINCHGSAFYAMGLITAKEWYDDRWYKKSRQMFPNSAFRKSSRNGADDDLKNILKKMTAEEVALVQLKGADSPSGDNGFIYGGHSFLAGVDDKNRITCFEMRGVGDEKDSSLIEFRITDLDSVCDRPWPNYYDGDSGMYWAAAPLSQVIKSGPATRIRRAAAAKKPDGSKKI